MAVAACLALAIPSSIGQIGIIAASAFAGMWLFDPAPVGSPDSLPISISHRVGAVWLTLFVALLMGLPVLARVLPYQAAADFDAFFRAGSLVFGGGHVVLPLLQAAVVPPGWVSRDAFLAGYGATQAVPGPLFTFAAYLGAAMTTMPSGWLGGMLCLIGIFAPSFLLIMGALPFWEVLRRNMRMRAALSGINAAVVGILLAALYDPIWTSAIHKPIDFGWAVLAFVALMFWKLPPWLVVACCGIAGWLVSSSLV